MAVAELLGDPCHRILGFVQGWKREALGCKQKKRWHELDLCPSVSGRIQKHCVHPKLRQCNFFLRVTLPLWHHVCQVPSLVLLESHIAKASRWDRHDLVAIQNSYTGVSTAPQPGRALLVIWSATRFNVLSFEPSYSLNNIQESIDVCSMFHYISLMPNAAFKLRSLWHHTEGACKIDWQNSHTTNIALNFPAIEEPSAHAMTVLMYTRRPPKQPSSCVTSLNMLFLGRVQISGSLTSTVNRVRCIWMIGMWCFKRRGYALTCFSCKSLLGCSHLRN